MIFDKIYNGINAFISKKMVDVSNLNKEEKSFSDFVEIIPKTAKWILLMLFAGGNIRKYNEPISGRIRLLKEIFLLKQQAKIKEDIYEFRPYKYGPFANEFLKDMDFLKENGYILEREGLGGLIYQLTPKGIKHADVLYDELDENIKRRLFGIKVRFNDMALNDLLDYVYSTYPKYAEKSEYFNNNPEGA